MPVQLPPELRTTQGHELVSVHRHPNRTDNDVFVSADAIMKLAARWFLIGCAVGILRFIEFALSSRLTFWV